jgi:hypothetical protein
MIRELMDRLALMPRDYSATDQIHGHGGVSRIARGIGYYLLG